MSFRSISTGNLIKNTSKKIIFGCRRYSEKRLSKTKENIHFSFFTLLGGAWLIFPMFRIKAKVYGQKDTVSRGVLISPLYYFVSNIDLRITTFFFDRFDQLSDQISPYLWMWLLWRSFTTAIKGRPTNISRTIELWYRSIIYIDSVW